MIAGLLAADHLFSYPRWPLTTSTLCSRKMGCVDSALGSAHGESSAVEVSSNHSCFLKILCRADIIQPREIGERDCLC